MNRSVKILDFMKTAIDRILLCQILKFVILHSTLGHHMAKETTRRTVFCRTVVDTNTKQFHKTTKYLASF